MLTSRSADVGRVAAVDEVLGEQDAEVAANRPGIGLPRVRRSDQGAHDLPRVFRTLDDHRHHGAAAHERHEVFVERLPEVLLVVPGEGLLVEGPQVHGGDGQALGLEAGNDGADQAALDGVRLEQHEGAIRHTARHATAAPGPAVLGVTERWPPRPPARSAPATA